MTNKHIGNLNERLFLDHPFSNTTELKNELEMVERKLKRVIEEEKVADTDLEALLWTCEEKEREVNTIKEEIEDLNGQLVRFEAREAAFHQERAETWPTLQAAGKVFIY